MLVVVIVSWLVKLRVPLSGVKAATEFGGRLATSKLIVSVKGCIFQTCVTLMVTEAF